MTGQDAYHGRVTSGESQETYRDEYRTMQTEPQSEHEWLQQLVGEWSFESRAVWGTDEPPCISSGTESVQSLGGLWVVGESRSPLPDGTPGTTLITLGYDLVRRRYRGTWIGSMMSAQWVYDGEVDASGKLLTLDTEGPAPSGEGLARYQDIIEIVDADHRMMRSRYLDGKGEWQHFMTSVYHRKK
jgi:hypothetical protein